MAVRRKFLHQLSRRLAQPCHARQRIEQSGISLRAGPVNSFYRSLGGVGSISPDGMRARLLRYGHALWALVHAGCGRSQPRASTSTENGECLIMGNLLRVLSDLQSEARPCADSLSGWSAVVSAADREARPKQDAHPADASSSRSGLFDSSSRRGLCDGFGNSRLCDTARARLRLQTSRDSRQQQSEEQR